MKRLAYIDGLRALAALMVYFTHLWSHTGGAGFGIHFAGVTFSLSAIPAVGYIGVNLFLVLSGFCLTWPFTNESSRHPTIWNFWKRRSQRILPAYYASILFVFALYFAENAFAARGWWPISAAHVPPVPRLAEIIPHLLMVHNLFHEHASTINEPYWSLALEFQLYLLFPLFLVCLVRCGKWRLLITVLIVQLAYRLALEWMLNPKILDEFGLTLPNAVFGRMFDFVMGMATAMVVSKSAGAALHWQKWHRLSGVLSALFLLVGFALRSCTATPGSILDVMWAVGFSSLIFWAAGMNGWANRALSWKPLAYLGAMSYSLYLMHEPLLLVACRILREYVRPGWAFLAGMPLLAVVIGFSWLLYIVVERPALDYFAKQRRAERTLSTAEASKAASASALAE